MCDSVAELRSVILKARRLAHDHAEQERAATAVKAWLLTQIEKKRAATADSVKMAPHEPFLERRGASAQLRRAEPERNEFATDSPLERRGFEPLVPLVKKGRGPSRPP